jgi:hypothetical protein
MGTYTAFHFAGEIKKETPADVVNVLKAMCGGYAYELNPQDVPEHEFFRAERWKLLFTGYSYYFPARTSSSFEFDGKIAQAWFLTATSSLKNYDNEIERFVDFISPYLSGEARNVCYKWTAEDDGLPIFLIPKTDRHDSLSGEKVK